MSMSFGASDLYEDGGFSIDRKGIRSMRGHLAHRELLKRGDREDLELPLGIALLRLIMRSTVKDIVLIGYLTFYITSFML